MSDDLKGKTVIVTRAVDRAKGLAERLEALGARVVLYPTIEQVADVDLDAFRADVEWLSEGGWLVFASASGVKFFFKTLSRGQTPTTEPLGTLEGDRASEERGKLHHSGGRSETRPCPIQREKVNSRGLTPSSIAAIGPATARAVEALGMEVAFTAKKSVGEAFANEFIRALADQKKPRILLPAARDGRTELETTLKEAGYPVRRLVVYRTQLPDGSRGPQLETLEPDYILFMSPSSAENFSRLGKVPESCKIITIGPTTSAAVRGLGWSVFREANPHSEDGLVKALLEG